MEWRVIGKYEKIRNAAHRRAMAPCTGHVHLFQKQTFQFRRWDETSILFSKPAITIFFKDPVQEITRHLRNENKKINKRPQSVYRSKYFQSGAGSQIILITANVDHRIQFSFWKIKCGQNKLSCFPLQRSITKFSYRISSNDKPRQGVA